MTWPFGLRRRGGPLRNENLQQLNLPLLSNDVSDQEAMSSFLFSVLMLI